MRKKMWFTCLIYKHASGFRERLCTAWNDISKRICKLFAPVPAVFFRGELRREAGLRPEPALTRLIEGDVYRYAYVEAFGKGMYLLVDFSSETTRIWWRRLDALGVKPCGERALLLGNGRIVLRDYGYVRLQFNGKSAVVPVIFALDNDVEVLGLSAILALDVLPQFSALPSCEYVEPASFKTFRASDPELAKWIANEQGFVALPVP